MFLLFTFLQDPFLSVSLEEPWMFRFDSAFIVLFWLTCMKKFTILHKYGRRVRFITSDNYGYSSQVLYSNDTSCTFSKVICKVELERVSLTLSSDALKSIDPSCTLNVLMHDFLKSNVLFKLCMCSSVDEVKIELSEVIFVLILSKIPIDQQWKAVKLLVHHKFSKILIFLFRPYIFDEGNKYSQLLYMS